MIYCENIVNVTLVFLLSPDFGTTFFFPHFRQCHCHNCYNFFPYFGNGISIISLSNIYIFFFSLWALHAHLSHSGNKIGQTNFSIHIAEIQQFLSPPFSSSLSYFWLNFGNGNTEIQSLSLESQISFNSSYNANLVQILQYYPKRLVGSSNKYQKKNTQKKKKKKKTVREMGSEIAFDE